MPNMGFRGVYAGANSNFGGRITGGDILPAIRGGFFPTLDFNYLLPSDPQFPYTTMLLKAIGSNTQQNYTFLDSSTNAFTVTRNGDTTQGAFSPYGIDDGKWSAYFDGNGDYLNVASNSAFNLTGDFTIEYWFYDDGSNLTYPTVVGNATGWTSGSFSMRYNNTGLANKVSIHWNPLGDPYLSSSVVASRTWHHVAFTRSGTTVTLWVNGVSQATATTSTTLNLSFGGLNIGWSAWDTTQGYYKGYVSNVRVLNGTALYTSNFTPSTISLTAISGTSLLTCQSNRFKDNSSNAFTVTRNGDTKVSAFTPFNQTAEYSASTNGGSAYFDGTGDTLTIASSTPNQFGSGDFTIETWYYCSGAISTSGQHLFFRRTTVSALGLIFQVDNSKLNLLAGDTNNINGWEVNISSTTTLTANRWYHLAMSRSGSSWKIFVDGVQEASINASFTIAEETANITIGTNITGYLSNLRVIKGTAVYTSNFTPPTSPVTAIANTTLLVSATNAGIIDASRKFNLITDGNAQVSTSISKFDKSIAYDGTGDIVKVLSPPDELNLTTATFTLEAWVYVTSLAAIRGIAGCATTAIVNNASIDWGFRINTDGTVSFLTCSSTAILQVTSTATIPLNTWVHVAVVREGASATVYVNGVGVSGTVHATTNSNRGVLTVGSIADINPMLGYIEDLRLTKGFKRYTANFTPPTSSLPTR